MHKTTVGGGLERLLMEVEKHSFEEFEILKEAVGEIKLLYKRSFDGAERVKLLNKEFIKENNLRIFLSDVMYILYMAGKYGIFLDRPNDPLCCLTYGIYNTYN